jgi:hypothetical protein
MMNTNTIDRAAPRDQLFKRPVRFDELGSDLIKSSYED